MGGAPLVIVLVGLVVPITMLFLAIVFDIAVVLWALYRVSHDRLRPMLMRFEDRVLLMAHLPHRPLSAR